MHTKFSLDSTSLVQQKPAQSVPFANTVSRNPAITSEVGQGVSCCNPALLRLFNGMVACGSPENLANHSAHLSKQCQRALIRFWGTESCQPAGRCGKVCVQVK